MVFGSTLGVIYADIDAADGAVRRTPFASADGDRVCSAVALEHARYVEWLEGENQRLQEEINIEHDMVGDSARMRDVYQFVSKVAADGFDGADSR